jgi:hypothetical protein
MSSDIGTQQDTNSCPGTTEKENAPTAWAVSLSLRGQELRSARNPKLPIVTRAMSAAGLEPATFESS